MVVLEVGRVCMKIAGREAGSYCVVIKPAGTSKKEKSFVGITGPKLLTGVKRRRSNINHLKATEHKLEIAADASDQDVIAAYDKAGLTNALNLKKPSAAQMKAKEAKAEAKKKSEKKSDKKDDKKSGKKKDKKDKKEKKDKKK